MKTFDVIIIGAGAAGLMCAMTAGRRGRRVLVLEHTGQAGAKILISGGGRCNFINRDPLPESFLSANPHFCKSALKRYTQHDFLALIERHGIAYHERNLGQLFCNGSAREIVAMLLAECAAVGVELRVNHQVTEISRPDEFRVATDHGGFTAPALVLATGGLSIPKMGATGFSHRVARQFDLALTATRPALVPLKTEGDDLALMEPLSGVSVEAVARCGRHAFRENILFTHRGLSGPAILQISSYWQEGTPITLDLVPDLDATDFLLARKKSRPKAELKTILGEVLPNRLAQKLTETRLPNLPMGGFADKALIQAAEMLKSWQLTPAATEGYAKAEVTLGGVDTAALSSKTMEARAVPGLYVIGEAVDVTGWLGGYNFQWAWSSGWCAGEAV
jgi:predicted Rossmann fold flavoprotein